MTKKTTQREFVLSLMNTLKCRRDEDFGDIMGVTKSMVGLWKNEKSPIPVEKFLTKFSKETLDYLHDVYGIEEPMISDSGDDVALEIGRGFIALVQKAMRERALGSGPPTDQLASTTKNPATNGAFLTAKRIC